MLGFCEIGYLDFVRVHEFRELIGALGFQIFEVLRLLIDRVSNGLGDEVACGLIDLLAAVEFTGH